MLLQYPKGYNSRQAYSLLTASFTPLSHYQPHLTLLFPTICLILLTLFSLSVSFYLLYSHYLSHSTYFILTNCLILLTLFSLLYLSHSKFFLPTICLILQYLLYSHYLSHSTYFLPTICLFYLLYSHYLSHSTFFLPTGHYLSHSTVLFLFPLSVYFSFPNSQVVPPHSPFFIHTLYHLFTFFLQTSTARFSLYPSLFYPL